MNTSIFDKYKPSKFLFLLIILTVFIIITVFIIVKIITSSGMPSISELENPKQNIATQIFSADGEVIDYFFIERRVPLEYNEIPKDFVNALVATEDKKYWTHWGVHSKRVLNSFIKNIFAGYSKEGASTITMQLAGNLYLNRRETSMTRKIREAVTAFQIEKTYTKEEIIELYTNTVNFGRGAYGLQVASNRYFEKEPRELTTAECAYLVGLLKKPEFFNKRDNYQEAIKRRNLVLYMMLEENFITSSKYYNSINESISFMQNINTSKTQLLKNHIANMGIAPHFVETIRQSIRDDKNLKEYDFYKDGLNIYTTINANIQRAINRVVSKYMVELQETFLKYYSWNRNKLLLQKLIDKAIKDNSEYKLANINQKQKIYNRFANNKRFIDSVKNTATTIQIGIVVIDPISGAILGMVGASPKFMLENPDAKYSLNHAVQIKRQPGSSFKPFVYASSLMKGKTPNSTIESGPFSYRLPSGEIWSPSGASKDSSCIVTYTQGLIGSINSVAARLITEVTTPDDVINLAKSVGIKSKLYAVPALSLGAGGDVSPLELTGAYGCFANNGIWNQPYFFDKITNRNNEIIYQKKQKNSIYQTTVFPSEIAEQMTYMLTQVVRQGTASRIKNYLVNIEAAGKTGTTNTAADAWFIGYTPQLVCGIWLGFDDRRINFNCLGSVGYGGRIAAPLWGKIMAEIYAIPKLRYTQKIFGGSSNIQKDTTYINEMDSLLNTKKDALLPYRLTKLQQENQVNLKEEK